MGVQVRNRAWLAWSRSVGMGESHDVVVVAETLSTMALPTPAGGLAAGRQQSASFQLA